MNTTLLTRISALALSIMLATVATAGVALMMSDSGDRAHLAGVQSGSQIAAMTQPQSAPTL